MEIIPSSEDCHGLTGSFMTEHDFICQIKIYKI